MTRSKDKIDSERLKPGASEWNQLIHDSRERLKELTAINQTTTILRSGKPAAELLHQICLILPNAWQHSQSCVSRIRYGNIEVCSPDFSETIWKQEQTFETIDGLQGTIQIFYRESFPEIYEGPFLKEERLLLTNLSNLITGHFNALKGKAIFHKTGRMEGQTPDHAESSAPEGSLLQTFLNRTNFNRDLYHDLMPFQVKEILLVANLFDAFRIDREGRFTEHVFGSYYSSILSTMPRITGVSSIGEVMQQLHEKHYDLIIILAGADQQFPVEISRKIKEFQHYIPVFLLLLNSREQANAGNILTNFTWVDRVFVYKNQPEIFPTMIRYLEDKINVENDTRIAMVRVILLVEDSFRFFSGYLPKLYNIVLEQTRNNIEEVTTDDYYRILRLKSRPKILLATTFEEAIFIFNRYKDNILCLITTVNFKKDGAPGNTAGFNLIRQVRSLKPDLPVIVQSTDPRNAQVTEELKATFLDKRSDRLMADSERFIKQYLGFGEFVYRNHNDDQIAVAKTLREFEDLLRTIPEDSLMYHARKDHFSLWLMARGEIQVAKILNPARVSDFKDSRAMREYLIQVIRQFRNEQNPGILVELDEQTNLDQSNMVALTDGVLNERFHEIAFVKTVVDHYGFSKLIPNINIRTPQTFIIGSDELDSFINCYVQGERDRQPSGNRDIRKLFLKGRLSDNLIRKLGFIVRKVETPLMVRAVFSPDGETGALHDAHDYFVIPNNDPDHAQRLDNLMDAIKLIFASVFSIQPTVTGENDNSVHHNDFLAVMIQQAVGHQHGNFFYPHISGTARSLNSHPFGGMKPGDGIAFTGLGFGSCSGDKPSSFIFSPAHPGLETLTPGELWKCGPTHLYALDLLNHDPDLIEGRTSAFRRVDLAEAEAHGTLKHLVSVYNPDKDRMTPGLRGSGPRVVNFADILKYNYIPMAKCLQTVLNVLQQAAGKPVEIEFAIDLEKDRYNKAVFYLLNVRALTNRCTGSKVDPDKADSKHLLLFSPKAFGEAVIDDVDEVVFLDPDHFDKKRTHDIADELGRINADMIRSNRRFVLISPVRWGGSQRGIGIPLDWPAISNAALIVETGIQGNPFEEIPGSLLMYDLIERNVGYVCVHKDLPRSFINHDLLKIPEGTEQAGFFKRIKFNKPLLIMVDGMKQEAVITLTR